MEKDDNNHSKDVDAKGDVAISDSGDDEAKDIGKTGNLVGIDVSNAVFMEAIFHTEQKGAAALVCSKSGDPTAGSWIAQRADEAGLMCPVGNNNYVNCSSFFPGADGTVSARKDRAAAFHFLMLDDVGSKASLERLGDFKPSWMLETSPGNFQAGFILAEPLTDTEHVLQLQNAAIHAELCDPGAKGMGRWSRLPIGINGKSKYRSAAGEAFKCKLITWNPELRYTADEIVEGLGLTLEPKTQKPQCKVTTLPAPISAPVGTLSNAEQAKKLKLCTALLRWVDPNCSREQWLKAMMAVFHHVQGSSGGFALVDSWSSTGKTYPGTPAVAVQWASFRLDVAKPVTIGTLIQMARDAGADTTAILNEFRDDAFEPCVMEVVDSADKSATTGKAVELAPSVPSTTAAPIPSKPAVKTNPLAKFSLINSVGDLEKQMVEEKLILGDIVLAGQGTVIYAAPNTGKTLILLWLMVQAIKDGKLDPSKLYYVNMDDNSNGLVTKGRVATEYDFHMIADGHRGFEAKEFAEAMEKMITENTAKGVVVVIDTLKKFVNTMDKNQSSSFTKVIRRFVLKGGTVVALAHVNKNPAPDGSVRYSGTTDIVDDLDCAYTVSTVSSDQGSQTKVVEFKKIKGRGNVASTAGYSYSTERGLSYNELLLSVQEVDLEQLDSHKKAAEEQSDATVIANIHACIADGINTKMKLAEAAGERSGASKRQALKVIEKYTGTDPQAHQWTYEVRERGAKVYTSLEQCPAQEPGTPGLQRA